MCECIASVPLQLNKMNIKDYKLSAIVDTIVRSHNDNRGCTIDILNGQSPTSGYIVSCHGYEKRINHKQITPFEVAEYLKITIYTLLSYQFYIGTWYNPEDGYTYFDLCKVITNKDDAIKYGKHQKQLTIYDIESQAIITL